MAITLISYSLKKGPHPPGLTRRPLDVRDIYNPARDPMLVALTGLDKPVQDAVWANESVRTAIFNLTEGGWQLVSGDVYGVRCTHGRHRSVAFIELLAERLRAQGIEVTVIHRELAT